MNAVNLLDVPSAAIVVGGTLFATLLRCGFADCRIALAAIGRIGRRGFDARLVQAELAVQVQEIHRDGLLRAHPHQMGDREFDEATEALIGRRSVSALLAAHENHRKRRQEAGSRAVGALSQAAELAPVFGLAGTLLSLTQLSAEGIARGSYTGAISMAVLTTLYGVLFANLLLAPLARAVERAVEAEERERRRVVEWLAEQVAPDIPRRKPAILAEAS